MTRNFNSPVLQSLSALTARIFHDLSGPIGSVANSVDLLSDIQNYPSKEGEQVLHLLNISCTQMIGCIHLFRFIYSSPKESEIDIGDYLQYLSNFLSSKDCGLSIIVNDKEVRAGPMSLIGFHIICNLCVLLCGAVEFSANIAVRLSDNNNGWSILLTRASKEFSVNQELLSIIASPKAPFVVHPTNVHALFTRSVMEANGYTVNIEVTRDAIILKAIALSKP